MAAGGAVAGSDVDLLIIGSIGLRQAVRKLRDAQADLGREINPVAWTIKEYQSRLTAQDHFLISVLREPRLFVVGDERKLGELDPEPVAQATPKLTGRSGHSARRRRR
jgi:predicted nucleotidyltransferase